MIRVCLIAGRTYVFISCRNTESIHEMESVVSSKHARLTFEGFKPGGNPRLYCLLGTLEALGTLLDPPIIGSLDHLWVCCDGLFLSALFLNHRPYLEVSDGESDPSPKFIQHRAMI